MNYNKILFIGSFKLPKNGHYGGVYFACTTLRDGLRKKGYQIVEMDTTLKDISDLRVINRLHEIIIRQIRFLIKILFNLNAKYLFVFLSSGNSYIDKLMPILFSKLALKKIIILPRSGHLIEDNKKTFYGLYVKLTLKISNKVICQSEFWRSYFKKLNVRESKLDIIENWVDDEKIEESIKLLYPKYNKETGEPLRIIFVTRIEKAKGVDDIISLAKIINNQLNYSIHVYGGGSYEKDFVNDIIRNKLENNVMFHGWLQKNKLVNTINSFHLAIFSSKIEGYPNSLLDYIFSKVPIISTDIPMIKEVGGDKIRYYECGNVNDLADKVLFIANNYEIAIEDIKVLYERKLIENNLSYSLEKLLEIIR